jgi:hypothetical protein
MRRALTLAVLATIFVVTPAEAFLGEGDLVFDPQSHAELIKTYEQVKELYTSSMKQLDRLSSIEQTIRDSQRTYEQLRNTNLQQYVSNLKPQGVDTITGLRAEIARLQSTAGGDASYLQFQMSRLAQLEHLQILKTSTDTSLTNSINPITTQAGNESITAQSSATLAALASNEEQRRINEEVAQRAAVKQNQDSFFDSSKVYGAIGGIGAKNK